MSMGLRDAPANFQALMNNIFQDLVDECIVIYWEDVLISSHSRDNHLKQSRVALKCLKENEVYEGDNKYDLMTKETESLGLMVGEDRISYR